MENIAVIFFTFILISIISFVVKTLTTSSGSKLKGNSLDDFILKKGICSLFFLGLMDLIVLIFSYRIINGLSAFFIDPMQYLSCKVPLFSSPENFARIS